MTTATVRRHSSRARTRSNQTSLDLYRASGANLVASRLQAIDWSFTKRGRPHEIEGIHPYPAKFIPSIPQTLLSMLPVARGTAVFDPFCGSGTTMVEAQRLGLPSVGVDLNPIACLISRVKTAPRPRNVCQVAHLLVEEARIISNPQSTKIPNVNHWFKPAAQAAIANLIAAIQD